MSGPAAAMTPGEHYRAAQEQLETARTLDPYEDESSRVLLSAITHALLAIAGQVTPVRIGTRP